MQSIEGSSKHTSRERCSVVDGIAPLIILLTVGVGVEVNSLENGRCQSINTGLSVSIQVFGEFIALGIGHHPRYVQREQATGRNRRAIQQLLCSPIGFHRQRVSCSSKHGRKVRSKRINYSLPSERIQQPSRQCGKWYGIIIHVGVLHCSTLWMRRRC